MSWNMLKYKLLWGYFPIVWTYYEAVSNKFMESVNFVPVYYISVFI